MQHLDEGMIHAWLDGELPAAERDAAEAHVAQCDHCSAAVAEARGFIAASSRILTALDAVPGGVLPAAASIPPAGTRAPARFTLSRAWMAAAAVLILSTATAIAIRPRSDEGVATLAQRDEMRAGRTDSTPSTPAAAPAIAAVPAEKKNANGAASGGPAPSAQSPRVDATSPLAANAPKPSALAEERQKSADKHDGAVSLARKDARVRTESGDSAPMVVAGAAGAARATEYDSAATLHRNSTAAAAAPPAAARATDAMAVKGEPAQIAPHVVERSTTKENGDTVVTTVYSVNGVPVSLIDQSSARLALQLPHSKTSVTDQPLAKVRDSGSATHSITWSDSTGHTRTLRGALSTSELEKVKRALFGPTP